MSNSASASPLAGAGSALAALCKRFGVRRLDLFGSAATERFDPVSSDLDFLVSFQEPLAPGTYGDAYFGLHAALEALFKRPVDLVTDSALANPYFRRQVDSERTLVFTSEESP